MNRKNKFTGPVSHDINDPINTHISSIQKGLSKSTRRYKTLNEHVTQLEKLNKKLTDGFNVSMHVIIDVSQILKQYTLLYNSFFHELDNIDKKHSVENEELQKLNDFTTNKINELNVIFDNQIDNIVDIYKSNDKTPDDINKLVQLKKLSESIASSGTTVSRGGMRKNKNKKK